MKWTLDVLVICSLTPGLTHGPRSATSIRPDIINIGDKGANLYDTPIRKRSDLEAMLERTVRFVSAEIDPWSKLHGEELRNANEQVIIASEKYLSSHDFRGNLAEWQSVCNQGGVTAADFDLQFFPARPVFVSDHCYFSPSTFRQDAEFGQKLEFEHVYDFDSIKSAYAAACCMMGGVEKSSGILPSYNNLIPPGRCAKDIKVLSDLSQTCLAIVFSRVIGEKW